jgi:hypothetical protein
MKNFFPIIAYCHQCNTAYMMSVLRFVIFCKENSISLSIVPITFESLISRARNAAADNVVLV